ncbi:MAG: hypothetical protein R2726_12130 [Acidimicrobiales bacterium]
MGKLIVTVGLGPELSALSALSIGLSPAQLAATERLFTVLAGGAVDLSEYLGILRTQLITGDFDGLGVTLQVLGSLATLISQNAKDVLADAAPALGASVGKVAGNVGTAISALSDVISIVNDLKAAIGTAKSLLDQVAQTESLYRGLLERALAALAALERARAEGCTCAGGGARQPDGSCSPPPPPPPPPGAPGPNPPGTDTTITHTTFVNSRDPNAITGPAGQGAERFVSASQPMTYTIDFENVKTAGAPAQEVVVSLPLDVDLDASTFHLGAIGFGSTRIEVPPDRRSFDTSVPLVGTPYTVQVRARLDLDTRVATWTFRTIDPATGDLPLDPTAGFLPPNVTSPQGEGYVELGVDPVPTAAPGTVLSEQASIVFDDNPAIATNTWTNTIGVPRPATAGGFHPLPPARILDTRSGVGGPATKIGPGETRSLKVTGVGGVPNDGVSAVAVNVTAVQPTAPSHLTVWPSGAALPGSSNLNFVAGQTIPNLVVSRSRRTGPSPSATTPARCVLGDVAGWFDFAEGSTIGRAPQALVPDDQPGASLVPVTPARILDTRPGTTVGGPAARLGPGETERCRSPATAACRRRKRRPSSST